MIEREVLKMECTGLRVRIDSEAYKKMRAYTELCSKEISGFARVKVEEGGFLIYDPFLIKQKVTGTSTDMDPEEVFNAVMDATKEGKDTADWGCWFHSHVNMGAFFSAVDVRTIALLEAELPLISIVMNKQGDYTCRVDFYKPFRMCIDGVELQVVHAPDDSLKEACKAEMAEKVSSASSGPYMSMAMREGNGKKPVLCTPRFFDSKGGLITPGDQSAEDEPTKPSKPWSRPWPGREGVVGDGDGEIDSLED